LLLPLRYGRAHGHVLRPDRDLFDTLDEVTREVVFDAEQSA